MYRTLISIWINVFLTTFQNIHVYSFILLFLQTFSNVQWRKREQKVLRDKSIIGNITIQLTISFQLIFQETFFLHNKITNNKIRHIFFCFLFWKETIVFHLNKRIKLKKIQTNSLSNESSLIPCVYVHQCPTSIFMFSTLFYSLTTSVYQPFSYFLRVFFL